MTDDEEKYIRTNAAYYDTAFRRLRGRRTRADWNWAAFLFPTSWFFYRKIYKWGILSIIFSAAICMIGGIITGLLALIFRLFVGIRGNNIYMEHIEAVVRGGQRLREIDRQRYSKLHCGTSLPLAILAFAATTAVICVIFYFFYS